MTIDDFIAVQPGAFDDAFCARAIDCFEQMHGAGLSYRRKELDQSLQIHKDDLSVVCTGTLQSADALAGLSGLFRAFHEPFWRTHLSSYVDAHPSLRALAPLRCAAFKLQRTDPGQGYHVWHYEDGPGANADRLLAWMIFLNDVDEGGETEFLYQHRRVRPAAGTLLIWPAGFTHTHRGNPPLSGSKYIATGWVER